MNIVIVYTFKKQTADKYKNQYKYSKFSSAPSV